MGSGQGGSAARGPGVAPGTEESSGCGCRIDSGEHGKLAFALVSALMAVLWRSPYGPLAALLVQAYHLLAHQVTYHELGASYLDQRDREQATRRYVKLLERLGHRVVLEPAA